MHGKFEEKLEEKLDAELDDKATKIFVDYTSAKEAVTDILKNIVRVEPGLTDHSIDHCNRVLSNVYELLGDDIDKFSAIELYCLGICVLFHDVGNVKGRERHKYEISEQYDRVRKDIDKYRDEKVIVIEVGEAHCGKAKDGSYDTLGLLGYNIDLILHKVNIRLCDITAVLRLADELDEGLFRTSTYALDNKLISDKNVVYHKYASDTKIDIFRKEGRIIVKYHITIPEKPNKTYKDAFENYMRFIYERIVKVNQERQYTKHYCKYLEPFKELSVSFHFWRERRKGEEKITHNLPPMRMTDLVVPKDDHYSIEDKYPRYKMANVMTELFGVPKK